MKKVKHSITTGDWKAIGVTVKVFKEDGSMLMVAHCYSSSFRGENLTLLEAEANARLIAIAPELLKILIEVEKYFAKLDTISRERMEYKQIELLLKIHKVLSET